jgi:hypothetical protein
MVSLKRNRVSLSLALLVLSNVTLAASPNDILKFKNPADQSLYEQGERVRAKQEACMEKPSPGCGLSAHDFQILNKSENLVHAMELGKQRLSGVIMYETAEKQWHPEDDMKALKEDQKALQDYKSKHPVVTSLSHINSALMQLTSVPSLQRSVDQASDRVELSKSQLKTLQTGIEDFNADIASYGLVVVPGKANSGSAQ